VSAIELPRAAVEIVVAEVAAWGTRGSETGGFLLCEENDCRVALVALSGGKGINRARDQFAVSGTALAALFGYAAQHGFSVRAQFHSHGRSAFLSPTDLKHGFNVEGFLTTVVPNFAAPSRNPWDWRWWLYNRDWEEIEAPAPVEGAVQIVRFDEEGAREG
jgi:hypothetical protein